MDQGKAATKMWDSFVGRMIEDRYFIQKKLGEGGVGAVYLAEDTKMMNRQVVVKVLLENWLHNADVRRKFEHEKEALARLDHPGIVSILDAGILPEDKPYIVMPFISGRTLRQVMDDQKILPLDFCADVIESFSEALETAHAAGILHRDIKPENIILTEQEDRKVRVRLIDFGIARVMNSQISPVTEVERFVGTTLYIAPEQLLGSLNQKSATDIYSCGIVAFEMLTGKLPFNPGSIIEMYQLQKEGVKQKPSAIRLELDSTVDNIILKALEYESKERFQKVLDFGRSLAKALRKLNDNKTTLTYFTPEITLNLMEDKTFQIIAETKPDSSDFVVKDEKRKNLPDPEPTHRNEAQNLTNQWEKLDFESVETRITEQIRENKPLLYRTSTWIGVIGIMLLIVVTIPPLIYIFNKPIVDVPPLELESNKITDQSTSPRNLQFYLDVQKMRNGKPSGKSVRATGQEIFETGDKFWMNISINTSGYFYLFNEGKDDTGKNTFNLMFPTKKQQKGSPKLETAQEIRTNENNFYGLPGKEIVWIIWTKDPISELEEARKDALQSGKVQRPEIAQLLSDFLQKYSSDQLEVTRDSDKKRTILQSNNNIMVHQMELEHR